MEQNLENALMTAPIQAQERIETLDIIRGVALLGILLIHFPTWFGTPALYLMILSESMWTNVWDTTVSSFIDLFFLGKFYTMFSFLFGVPMSVVKYLSGSEMCYIFPNVYTVIHYTAGIVGDMALSIFYTTSIILLSQKVKWAVFFKPFGYVGRMALSNYLLQSVIGTMIFYNYGLGLYGQIAPAFGMVLALVIFVIQIIISKWWLSRYQFGPVEWVWKGLTYGKRFGMKR